MKKLFFSLIVLFSISMIFPISFGALYYDKEYSFSIEYPDGWRVINGDVIRDGIYFMDGKEECTQLLLSPFDCLWNTNVNVSLYPDVGDQLSDSEEREWITKDQKDSCDSQSYINFGDSTCKNFKIIKEFPSTTVDGYRIITSQFSMIKDYPDDFSSTGTMIQLTSYIYDDKDIWVINSESDEDVFDEHEKLIWNMINSFKYPTTPPPPGTMLSPLDVPERVSETEISESKCGTGTELVNGVCQVIKAEEPEEKEGGGCLIATAAYGSELAPQVQQLRELRDNQLLQTESGSAFMSGFNELYYSFSPTIADMQREHPLFKETVKLAITPMISSLSLMENAESESEVLGIGMSVIMLNLGMYFGVPAIVVIGIRKLNNHKEKIL